MWDDKVLPVFLWNKCVAAMRTVQIYRREAAFRRRELRSANFAEDLSFRSIVFVNEWFRGIVAAQKQSSGMSHSERYESQ